MTERPISSFATVAEIDQEIRAMDYELTELKGLYENINYVHGLARDVVDNLEIAVGRTGGSSNAASSYLNSANNGCCGGSRGRTCACSPTSPAASGNQQRACCPQTPSSRNTASTPGTYAAGIIDPTDTSSGSTCAEWKMSYTKNTNTNDTSSGSTVAEANIKYTKNDPNLHTQYGSTSYATTPSSQQTNSQAYTNTNTYPSSTSSPSSFQSTPQSQQYYYQNGHPHNETYTVPP